MFDKPGVLAVLAAALLSIGVLSGGPWGDGALALPPGTAAAGTVTLGLDSGDNTSLFTATPAPVPASCPGTAADGHFWQTFMTPTSIDPGTLTYNADGPVPVGTEFTLPLFASGVPIVNMNPATSPAGLIVGAPDNYDFAAFVETDFEPPAGEYYIGVACTLAGDTTIYWATAIEITAAASPLLFTWEATDAAPPSSSSTSSTTAPGSSTTTTTTAPSGSSTTTTSSTTTSSTSSTTTTTLRPTTSTTVFRSSSGSGSSGTGSTGSGSGSLASTGSSSLRWVVWGAFLLVIGRMLLLLGRRTKVLPGG